MKESFSENLKFAMGCKDFHTKDLSSLTGIKTDTISSYLKSNGSEPTASKAVVIAKALGVSVEFLMTGKDSKNNFFRPDVERLARKLNTLPASSIKLLSNLVDLLR